MPVSIGTRNVFGPATVCHGVIAETAQMKEGDQQKRQAAFASPADATLSQRAVTSGVEPPVCGIFDTPAGGCD